MPNQETELSWFEPILQITKQKAAVITEAMAKQGHFITKEYGYQTVPDHNDKRCVDFMHYGDQGMRKAIEKFILDNYKALGVNGMISNHGDKGGDKPVRVGFPNSGTGGNHYHGPAGVWSAYTGPNHHTDHVHVEFNTNKIGSIAGVSKPKKNKAYPKPTSGEVYLDKLHPGKKNSDSVYYWRMAMNAISFKGGSELPLNGNYTDDLVHETKLFQDQKCDDPQDGWPGPKQSELGFKLAEKEMKARGVKHLSIYKSSTKGGLVHKCW